MIWVWLRQFAGWLDGAVDRVVVAWLRGWFRLLVLVGLWWVLNTREWIPNLVAAVVVVPLLFGILVCGGPAAAYNSTRYTTIVRRNGGTLMTISAAFAVGSLIGLSILSGRSSHCGGSAWCLAVMWWTICTGSWTVLAGIWGMTRRGDGPVAVWQREVAARIVVGTTVVAAVLLALFGLMFSGAI